MRVILFYFMDMEALRTPYNHTLSKYDSAVKAVFF